MCIHMKIDIYTNRVTHRVMEGSEEAAPSQPRPSWRRPFWISLTSAMILLISVMRTPLPEDWVPRTSLDYLEEEDFTGEEFREELDQLEVADESGQDQAREDDVENSRVPSSYLHSEEVDDSQQALPEETEPELTSHQDVPETATDAEREEEEREQGRQKKNGDGTQRSDDDDEFHRSKDDVYKGEGAQAQVDVESECKSDEQERLTKDVVQGNSESEEPADSADHSASMESIHGESRSLGSEEADEPLTEDIEHVTADVENECELEGVIDQSKDPQNDIRDNSDQDIDLIDKSWAHVSHPESHDSETAATGQKGLEESVDAGLVDAHANVELDEALVTDHEQAYSTAAQHLEEGGAEEIDSLAQEAKLNSNGPTESSQATLEQDGRKDNGSEEEMALPSELHLIETGAEGQDGLEEPVDVRLADAHFNTERGGALVTDYEQADSITVQPSELHKRGEKLDTMEEEIDSISKNPMESSQATLEQGGQKDNGQEANEPEEKMAQSIEEDEPSTENAEEQQGRQTMEEVNPECEHRWSRPLIGALANGGDLRDFLTLEEALAACKGLGGNKCRGVTWVPPEATSIGKHAFSFSSGPKRPSLVATDSGELSYVLECRTNALAPQMGEPFLEAELDWPESKSLEKNLLEGYTVQDEESILVHIASYRDTLCRSTIASALREARHPGRLRFALVEQFIMGLDHACLPSAEECRPAPDQTRVSENDAREVVETTLVCDHLDQIRVHKVDARLATGPTCARAQADKLYRGETYLLQIDAHMVFARDWDVELERQWQLVDDELAVLSAYPTPVLGSLRSTDMSSLRNTTPVMCRSGIMPDIGIPRFSAALERNVAHGDEGAIYMQPYWAAGMSFSRGHRISNVPYECYPFVFMGEEFAMALRMFTNGYNFYHFGRSAIFHFYPAERAQDELPPSFFENEIPKRQQAFSSSSAHLKRLLVENSTSDKYGHGRIRPLQEYFEHVGIKLNEDRTRVEDITRDLCPDVLQGHFQLSVYGKPARDDGNDDGDVDSDDHDGVDQGGDDDEEDMRRPDLILSEVLEAENMHSHNDQSQDETQNKYQIQELESTSAKDEQVIHQQGKDQYEDQGQRVEEKEKQLINNQAHDDQVQDNQDHQDHQDHDHGSVAEEEEEEEEEELTEGKQNENDKIDGALDQESETHEQQDNNEEQDGDTGQAGEKEKEEKEGTQEKKGKPGQENKENQDQSNDQGRDQRGIKVVEEEMAQMKDKKQMFKQDGEENESNESHKEAHDESIRGDRTSKSDLQSGFSDGERNTSEDIEDQVGVDAEEDLDFDLSI